MTAHGARAPRVTPQGIPGVTACFWAAQKHRPETRGTDLRPRYVGLLKSISPRITGHMGFGYLEGLSVTPSLSAHPTGSLGQA